MYSKLLQNGRALHMG